MENYISYFDENANKQRGMVIREMPSNNPFGLPKTTTLLVKNDNGSVEKIFKESIIA